MFTLIFKKAEEDEYTIPPKSTRVNRNGHIPRSFLEILAATRVGVNIHAAQYGERKP